MEDLNVGHEGAENAIQMIYQTLEQEDWRLLRWQCLHLLAAAVGASSAAWQTTAFGHWQGPVTQLPGLPLAVEELVQLPRSDEPQILGSGQYLSFQLPHPRKVSALISHFWLFWSIQALNTEAAAARQCRAQQLAVHVMQAVELSWSLLVQQDDRLQRMGRHSRGLAALVDAQGGIYAASERLVVELLGDALRPAVLKLPFALPEGLFAQAVSLRQGGRHWRIVPMGGLLLLHVRQPQLLDALSPREQEIARALGKGKTFKSIAAQCDIALSTVANHATRIYKKLGVFRREELIALLQAPQPVARIRPSRR